MRKRRTSDPGSDHADPSPGDAAAAAMARPQYRVVHLSSVAWLGIGLAVGERGRRIKLVVTSAVID